MEGPRPVAPHEMPSLSRLVDTVFVGGEDGRMFADFPTLFHADNLDNLLVFSEGGEIVSHVGQVQRWASLGGCTVRVALIGSVSTLESHRGAGLAGRLFAAACEKARADGVDYMMISGDRTLYTRAGATYVGRDFEAAFDSEAAGRIDRAGISLASGTEAHIPLCAAAYDMKPARFVRPPDDWRAYCESRQCTGPSCWTAVHRSGEFAGYLVHSFHHDVGLLRVGEWGGEAQPLCAALAMLITEYGAGHAILHVQSGDTAMLGALRSAGANLRSTHTSGTHLILNYPQLMRRMMPYFEARIGLAEATRLRFTQDGDRFGVALGDEEHAVEGLANLARLVFGHPEAAEPPGFLSAIFPIPALWYGIGYI